MYLCLWAFPRVQPIVLNPWAMNIFKVTKEVAKGRTPDYLNLSTKKEYLATLAKIFASFSQISGPLETTGKCMQTNLKNTLFLS